MKRAEIVKQIREKKSFLCVGLDSDIRKIPSHLMECADPVFEFNKQIIDEVAPYSVALKPNLAFYESQGAEGWRSLERTVLFARENYPELFLIADAKRGDIGNTSALYARAFFDQMQFDAITVAPYMGSDSVSPFLQFDGKWIIVLAVTSNAGADNFQFKQSEGKLLYEWVLHESSKWGNEGNIMYVAGATRPEMFSDIRKIVPGHFLLVPGVGAQGGDLQAVAKYGMTDECGLLVNASRSIIFANGGTDFANAAGIEAKKLQQEMEILLQQKGII
ncbi:MAG: orotidine-5'-phosphate decarboxylase [Bacteroidetes bacterium]|nr:orotidine-5'-phosphate decarboxylase [Bacteroidota bacterium]